MNYLAHLYLAEDDPESLVGNLMGDFVKGPIPDELPDKLRSGVVLHRKIDSYTDAHPLFRRSKQRLRPGLRRYGGILVDIYYDHFLARHWESYSSTSLRGFSRSVYHILQMCHHPLPERMQHSVSYMIANDLLMSYRELDGVGCALRGVSGRLRRENPLADAVLDLRLHYTALGDDFAAFFPELIAFVGKSRDT